MTDDPQLTPTEQAFLKELKLDSLMKEIEETHKWMDKCGVPKLDVIDLGASRRLIERTNFLASYYKANEEYVPPGKD